MQTLRVILVLTLLSAMASVAQAQPTIIATIHPLAAVLDEIAAPRTKVVRLLPAGASPHTFEPRPSDVRTVESAAVLFYISPGLDGFAARLPAPRKVAVIDFLPESYILHGRHSHEETKNNNTLHNSSHETGSDHEEGVDPHFWTDPQAVKATIPGIVTTLCSIDAEGCSHYQTRGKQFAKDLDKLDLETAATLKPVKSTPFLLAYPFLTYFIHRYKLRHAGTIVTVPGKEPSPRDLARTIKLGLKQKIRMIYTMPQLPQRPADVVAESIHAKVHVIDPIGQPPMRYRDIIEAIAKTLRTNFQ